MQDLEISLTPSGRLVVEEISGGEARHDDSRVPSLRDAFAESSAEGLLFLATEGLQMQLPPALVFWRDFAKGLFHTLCREGQQAEASWSRLRPPPELRLAVLASEAPPMRGLEYLTVAHLRQLWTELRDLIAERAASHPQGPEGFLQEANPVWHLLGRVTFHLAENKNDPDRPFAFLATYTHQLAAGSRLKHLPLAQALQEYAGARNQAQLASLLEPVRRAAEQSPLVSELLRSKALFRPQAWTADQGYRLLKEAPQIEDSGVVLRLPDWWTPRRPMRAQVQIQLGRKPSASLSMDHLLDFAVDVVLDGEPLTDEERQQILETSEGLVLLRGKWVEVDRGRLNQALEHWERLQADHPDGVSFIEGMRLLAGTTVTAADDDQADTAEWSHVAAGDWLRETLEQLRDPSAGNGMPAGARSPGHAAPVPGGRGQVAVVHASFGTRRLPGR